jgi:hypothetical protein
MRIHLLYYYVPSPRVMHIAQNASDPGDFPIHVVVFRWGSFWAYINIVGQDSSDSKSSRLHVDIFRFCFNFFIWRYILP